MSDYNESNIKTRAVNILINIVLKNNKHLGTRLVRYQKSIRDTAIKHIQQVGIHEYATQLLKPKSEEVEELKSIMNKWEP